MRVPSGVVHERWKQTSPDRRVSRTAAAPGVKAPACPSAWSRVRPGAARKGESTSRYAKLTHSYTKLRLHTGTQSKG